MWITNIKKYLVVFKAFRGLHYKHTTIVNYASSVVNKVKALLTDDAGDIIYNCHVFIVQATDLKANNEMPQRPN